MRQQALKTPFVHKLDYGVRLALSLWQDLVSAQQLVMAVEVTGDHDIKAWATAAMRFVYRLCEQVHRSLQRRSIASFYIY